MIQYLIPIGMLAVAVFTRRNQEVAIIENFRGAPNDHFSEMNYLVGLYEDKLIEYQGALQNGECNIASKMKNDLAMLLGKIDDNLDWIADAAAKGKEVPISPDEVDSMMRHTFNALADLENMFTRKCKMGL